MKKVAKKVENNDAAADDNDDDDDEIRNIKKSFNWPFLLSLSSHFYSVSFLVACVYCMYVNLNDQSNDLLL